MSPLFHWLPIELRIQFKANHSPVLIRPVRRSAFTATVLIGWATFWSPVAIHPASSLLLSLLLPHHPLPTHLVIHLFVRHNTWANNIQNLIQARWICKQVQISVIQTLDIFSSLGSLPWTCKTSNNAPPLDAGRLYPPSPSPKYSSKTPLILCPPSTIGNPLRFINNTLKDILNIVTLTVHLKALCLPDCNVLLEVSTNSSVRNQCIGNSKSQPLTGRGPHLHVKPNKSSPIQS